jgi:Protein of unknown function (DUF2934)
MQGTEKNRDEEIREVAYKLWQEEGYPHGYEVSALAKSRSDLAGETSSQNQI